MASGVRLEVGAAQRHHVAGRGFLPCGGQAGGILEQRAAHAQGAGLAVHLAHESPAVAVDVLGHGHGRVIAEATAMPVSRRTRGTRSPARRCMDEPPVAAGLAADLHFPVEGNTACLDRVQGQKHAHELGQRGGRNGRVGALLIQHAAVFRLTRMAERTGSAARAGMQRDRERPRQSSRQNSALRGRPERASHGPRRSRFVCC